MVVVVAMITITIFLSMVLEETVLAMRKEDITQAKVVQPALYARRLKNAVVCKIASAN